MAKNPAATYGRDVRCIRDADSLFSAAEGIDVVEQDAIHRITTDDILGDDGTGSFVIKGWGFDCRHLLGLPTSRLAAHQPILAEVLMRDPRIDHAEVVLRPVVRNGMADVEIRAACETELGPFGFIKSVLELTGADLVGQGGG